MVNFSCRMILALLTGVIMYYIACYSVPVAISIMALLMVLSR